jgi:hypothetical protein
MCRNEIGHSDMATTEIHLHLWNENSDPSSQRAGTTHDESRRLPVRHSLVKSQDDTGRLAIAQVRRRLATTAARLRSWVRSYGISGEQNGTGASFLQVLQTPLPILIPLSSRAGTTGPLEARVPSGLSLILHHQLNECI